MEKTIPGLNDKENGYYKDTDSDNPVLSNGSAKRKRYTDIIYLSIIIILGASLIGVVVYFTVFRDDTKLGSSHGNGESLLGGDATTTVNPTVPPTTMNPNDMMRNGGQAKGVAKGVRGIAFGTTTTAKPTTKKPVVRKVITRGGIFGPPPQEPTSTTTKCTNC